MNSDALKELYEAMDALRAEGKEDEAKALLLEKLRGMSEQEQGEILLAMFNNAVENEAAGLEAVREFQEQGLVAAKELQKQKKAK